MLIQDWLGKDNLLGIDIWDRKYRYEEETLDQWFNRVSGGNKDIEKIIKEKTGKEKGRTGFSPEITGQSHPLPPEENQTAQKLNCLFNQVNQANPEREAIPVNQTGQGETKNQFVGDRV